MMQWTPLAQAKNEGAHLDLTLAEDRWRVRGGGRKKSIGEAEWMQQISMHYIMFYDRISLGCDAQGKGGTRQQGRILFLEVFMVITQWARFYVLKLKQRAIQQLAIVQDLKRQKSCFVIEAN